MTSWPGPFCNLEKDSLCLHILVQFGHMRTLLSTKELSVLLTRDYLHPGLSEFESQPGRAAAQARLQNEVGSLKTHAVRNLKKHLVTLSMPHTDLRHHQPSNDLYVMAFNRRSYV